MAADDTPPAQSAEIGGVDHQPLEVTETDGMPFVKCSCDADNPRKVRWQTAYWLRDHWQGTQVAGVAAIHAVIDRQREEADRA